MAQHETKDREAAAAAKALRCWAREITTNHAQKNKLRCKNISSCSAAAQNGVNGDDDAPEPPAAATRSPLAVKNAASSEKQIFSNDLPPPGGGLLSLEGWLEKKLVDERRKWMVTLYRATNGNSKRPVGNPRQQQPQGSSSTELSSTEPSSTQQRIVVQAADFCCRCGSIVDVGLESTAATDAAAAAAGGVFVTEHRSGCSSCENEQHNNNRRAINGSSTEEAPRLFCRKGIILHRCHADRNRRSGQQEDRPTTPLRQRLASGQSRRAPKPSLSDGQSLSPATATTTKQAATTTGRDRELSHNHREESRQASAPTTPAAYSHPTKCNPSRTGRTRLQGEGSTKPVRGVSAQNGDISGHRRGRSRSTPLWSTASVPVELLPVAGIDHRKGDTLRPTDMSHTPHTPDEERANQRVLVFGDDLPVSSGSGRVSEKKRVLSGFGDVGDDRSVFSGRVLKERTFHPSAGRSDRGRDREKKSIRAGRKNIPKNDPTLLTATPLHARGDGGRGNNLSKQAQEAANASAITGSGQGLPNGVVSVGEGNPPPVDRNWAEEIRSRDEQIQVLKQQLASLGARPVAEKLSLQEARKRLREAISTLMNGDGAPAKKDRALETWSRYLSNNHPDHIAEQAEEEEEEWGEEEERKEEKEETEGEEEEEEEEEEEGRKLDSENARKNAEMLRLMITFVPPDVFCACFKELLRGGGLPPTLAKRFFARKGFAQGPFGPDTAVEEVTRSTAFGAAVKRVVASRKGLNKKVPVIRAGLATGLYLGLRPPTAAADPSVDSEL